MKVLLMLSAPAVGSAFAFLSRRADFVPRTEVGTGTVHPNPRTHRVAPLGLFGFGEDDSASGEDGELAMFSNLASTDQKFDSVSEYIREWGALFEGENKAQMGLTTPVKVLPSSGSSSDEGVTKAAGIRIVFQLTKISDAYKSKDDESVEEAGEGKREKEPKKEGGVEVLAERLTGGEVRVRASRCDIDEGTVIKEMSEGVIITELKKAIDVWRKEQA